MNLRLRIIRIDHDGYNGRDHSPSETDRGAIVHAISLETFYTNLKTGEEDTIDEDNAAKYLAAFAASVSPNSETMEFVSSMYTAVAADGRLLQLMDHEVEILAGEAR
jgi:hypothetical protein